MVLSQKLGSVLHVVYVEPVSIYSIPERLIYAPDTQDYLGETFERHARERLDEQVEKISEAGGEVAEAHPTIGRPDAEIVRITEDLGAGLVVLDSRGLGSLKRALMGSVSDSVVRHAHCPVLVVRGNARNEREGEDLLGRILLAVDGSREATAAREAAVQISNASDSELHVVFVLPTEPYVPHLGPEMPEDWKGTFERAEQHARTWLDQQVKQIEAEGGTVAGAHLALGRPRAEIVRLGDELDADLIVVGSRGLGGVRRALMGSVSDSVVCHARCSVLVVREEDTIAREGEKQERSLSR